LFLWSKEENQFNAREKNIKVQNSLMNIYESKINKELGISGRLWAAYNAVTEFIDHPIDYKLGDNRLLKRIWFGEGETLKTKAYLAALELIRKKTA